MIVLVHRRRDAFEEALACLDDLEQFWGNGTAFERPWTQVRSGTAV